MRKRYFNITLSSVVSMLAVVCMHANTKIFDNAEVTSGAWLSAHLMISICYFAVPVFFMITGATLMDYRDRYSTRDYFRARIKKTVIPFILWSLIALVFQLLLRQVKLSSLTVPVVITGILKTKYLSIYWFFLKLFSVYLMIPVISLIPKEKREKAFLYVMAVAFVLEKLVPFLNKAFSLSIPVSIRMEMGYDCYWFVFAGYYLQNKKWKRGQRIAVYIAGLAGFLIQFVGTYRLSLAAGEVVDILQGSRGMANLLYSVAVFVLLQQIAERMDEESRLSKLISFLSGYTFGVYLTHRYFLTVLEWIPAVPLWSTLYRALIPWAVTLVCVALIWAVRKIPVLGKVILP